MKSFNHTTTSYTLLLFIILVAILATLLQAQDAVWTRQYNNQRTGANTNEKILNTDNVNPRQFGKLFSRKVEGMVYAQPLYVPNLTINSKSHNVLIVATMANNVYAFDADSPELSDPLWMKNFGPSLPMSDNAVGTACGVFKDIEIEAGIVSTPVIDVSSKTLYFVTLNKDASDSQQRHRLHAIDLLTGGEKQNSPVVVEGQVKGTGDGNVNGIVTFDSKMENQRMGLTLLNGVVYFGFGGYCRTRPYHGWLFGYDAKSLERKFIFCSTPNGHDGGIWQGAAPVATDDQYLYLITANGYFSSDTGDYGNSYLKVDPSDVTTSGDFAGSSNGVVSYFTPFNQKGYDDGDLDVGATNPILIPDTDLMFGCSKDGWCYLVNKDNMGGYSGDKNNNIQTFKPNPDLQTVYHGIHSTIVTWKSPDNERLIYLWGVADTLRVYKVNVNGRLGTLDQNSKTSSALNGYSTNFPGGMLTISSDGTKAGTGIVWASLAREGSAIHDIRPGELRAFDASDINNQLWTSADNSTRDTVGLFAKWNPPIVANGKVYVGTFSSPPSREAYVHAYGLLTNSCPTCSNGLECCMDVCYDPSQSECNNGNVEPRTSQEESSGAPVVFTISCLSIIILSLIQLIINTM
jgi:hypothetical protein